MNHDVTLTLHDVFTFIDMDGINVGFKDDFTSTYLEFETPVQAKLVADHWLAWMNHETWDGE